MRVAALSDIHGNSPALDAVLADVAREPVDAVVITGDVASGPDPVGVLDRLYAAPWPVYWVKGNADQELIDVWDGKYIPTSDPYWDTLTVWAAGQLTRAHRDRMTEWPNRLTLPIDRVGEVLFAHATPRSLDEIVLVDSSLTRWQAVLDGVTEPLVVLGHTHMPFDRLVDRRRVVNTGSVGMPYGTASATWGLIGPNVVLRQSTYDVEQADQQLRALGSPDVDQFVRDYIIHPASDTEALRVFHRLPDI